MLVQHSPDRGLRFKPFDLGMSARWLEERRRKASGRIGLNPRELALVERIKRLKKEAGSHSPSAWTLAKLVPELRLKVDACFLSNPYATKLFLMHFQREVIRPRKLRALLELYPSQNRVIASKLGRVLELPPDSIFVGNGAAEIIQAILHRFTHDKILVNLPTFSPYYEFAQPDTQVVYNVLRKEDDFHFDCGEYLDLVRREQPDTVVLINPNNPDGGYISRSVMRELLGELRSVPNVIVDESFIHFACEGSDYTYRSVADLVSRFPNLTVVKSMSKDFGVAGIRAGYAVMAPGRVRTLLENGYLWNSSGLAEYFFDLYSRPDFQARLRARAHSIHPQLAPVFHRAPQDQRAARLSDLCQLRLGRARERPQCRGARLPLVRSGAESTRGPATTKRGSRPASSSGSPPAAGPKTPTSSARSVG